jgi:pterin-4a-carbinolamine dehydratase
MPEVFISYRREDSGPSARRLADTLAYAFGPEMVFIDTDSIRSAENWQHRINGALASASVLLVVIGPKWLFAQDEDGRRRLDFDGDWVRNEILAALSAGRHVLPILVSGAKLPKPTSLPDVIRPLTNFQKYALQDEYWERDTSELIRRLGELGLKKVDPHGADRDVLYPPPVDTSKPLTPEEQSTLLSRLPEWEIVKRPGVKEGDPDRVELYRAFRFKSFEDAIHFMFTASRFISSTNHHPDWQNAWISVRVWLTTWDVGHKPTFKDSRLAEYLEKLFREYVVS